MGGGGAPIVEDPRTLRERSAVAQVCLTRLDLEPMPALVDDVDDSVNDAYGAWPDRIYLIGRDGKVAYQGGPGPFMFRPDELEAAIRAELELDEYSEASERRDAAVAYQCECRPQGRTEREPSGLDRTSERVPVSADSEILWATLKTSVVFTFVLIKH